VFSLLGRVKLLSSPVPFDESSPGNMDGMLVAVGLEIDDEVFCGEKDGEVFCGEKDDAAFCGEVVDILDRRGGPAE
jgi:hypothetical protein